MRFIGIDIGFGDASTGVTFINSISEEISCFDLETKNYGFDKWAYSIRRKLDQIKEEYGRIDYVGIEKNFGAFRGVACLLDYAVGVIIGWCINNGSKYALVNPVILNDHIGFKQRNSRIPRKEALSKYVHKILGEEFNKIENIQDVIDSFCVADYVMKKYCLRSCNKFQK